MTSTETTLTIVGLGPGSPDDVTRRAWRVLHEAPTLYLRTARHPVVAAIERPFHSFDALYDSATDFDSLYAEIAGHLLQLAQREPIVYAVPGHPLVGEQTVSLLLEQAAALDLPVHIVDGLSFYEPSLALLGIEGMAGMQIHNAVEIALMYHPPLNPDQPALLGQVYQRQVASDLKLTLMNQYPDDHPVVLVHGAGLPEARREALALYEIDRSPHLAHLSSLYLPPLPSPSSFERFQETIAHLRSSEGCPWDRKQTHQSLRPYLIEEAAEVLDAIDADDPAALCEELGDLLLQVVLHSQIAIEEGSFTMADILAGINAKIIRRHPHVWGEVEVQNEDDLRRVWEAQKQAEKDAQPAPAAASILEGLPRSLSALTQAAGLQKKAATIGFDWATIEPVLAKVFEEIDEIREAENAEDRSAEMGDLLFAVVNWARWLEIDPEIALREASQRFRRRFQYIEQQAAQQGRSLESMSLAEMDALWDEAKVQSGTEDAPGRAF